MNALDLVMFSVVAGFTVSGIAANLYRVVAPKQRDNSFDTVRMVVMIVAGPSVLFEAAMRGLLSKQWGVIAFALAASTVLYWSFAIGLLAVNIALYLRSPF